MFDVPSAPTRKFTRDEIIARLTSAIREAIGDSNLYIEPHETVDLCFKRLDEKASRIWRDLHLTTWDDLDFADILYAISDDFGLGLKFRSWEALLAIPQNSKGHWTRLPVWLEIIEIVEARALKHELEPMLVLGRPCLPAGAFRALRDLARHCSQSTSRRIAPADSVQSVMKWKQTAFLNRIERNFGIAIPSSSARRRFVLGMLAIAALNIAAALITRIVIQQFDREFELPPAIWTASLELTLLASAMLMLMKRFWSPLPANLRTFEGLSRWLADQKGMPHATSSPR